MEKKRYMMPIVDVANIETESFCAASLKTTLDSTNEINSASMLSKENNGFDIWGTEDDDE
jgi:hypothetical protein